MYIEYPTGNDPENGQGSLMIMDGGPATYGPQNGFAGASAPYYKYFLSAGRQIWQQVPDRAQDTLEPSAIIASHAHEDHVGGILQLLLTWRNQQAGIVFNGPVYIPAQRTASVDAMVNQLDYLLTDVAAYGVDALCCLYFKAVINISLFI